MATLLSDYNCEKQSQYILHSLIRMQYIEWLNIELVFFRNVGLPVDSADEEVWQFCQENGYYLLTGNRSRKDDEASLHDVLVRLSNEESLPVITIGNLKRVIQDELYCEACAKAIAEIIFNVELYVGIPRLYIPF